MARVSFFGVMPPMPTAIGRSGLNYAFVTINNGCTLGCPPPPAADANQVLYPNCTDSYTVTTNDTNEFPGPRAELIPASGIWGRCGSVFDPRCDGAANPVDHQPGACSSSTQI